MLTWVYNRGQETITYLLHGSVDHEDFAGNKGTIYAGDLQFMTAGRGIVHAEMPGKNDDGSPNVGLQLWVDLPKNLKYCEPRYRDLRGSEIPTTTTDDARVTIKIISGNSHGVDSVKDLAYTPVWLLDVTMQPGGKLSQPLPKGWNTFVYVLKGSDIVFGEKTKVGQYYNVVFDQNGDGIDVLLPDNATEEARFGKLTPHSTPHRVRSGSSTNVHPSDRCRPAPRPQGSPVRPVRSHVGRGGVRGDAGLPVELERL